jgi:hypothetical protein
MAMALESWDGFRLGLIALGYQQVIWTHLYCVAHGVFKVAIAEELEEYPCPTCQQACKVAIVAQGFTRYALLPPERLSKPTAFPRSSVASQAEHLASVIRLSMSMVTIGSIFSMSDDLIC